MKKSIVGLAHESSACESCVYIPLLPSDLLIWPVLVVENTALKNDIFLLPFTFSAASLSFTATEG